jgi:hypothetical protein
VGDAPALGYGEVEERRQLGAGTAGDVVAPGAEGDQQLSFTVERHVAVHHSADAQGCDGAELERVTRTHVTRE